MSDAQRSLLSRRAHLGATGRLIFSLTSIAAVIGVILLGPSLNTATASGEAEDPASDIFPTIPGSIPVRLDGEIAVDGRSLSTSIVRLDAPPDEVIAYLRRHYEALPVDLLEETQADRRVLSVWDVHQGRRLLLSAQRLRSGGTELIRSWSPIQPAPAPDQSAELPSLPPDLRPISRIDDRLGDVFVTTSSYTTARKVDEIVKDLIAHLEAGGWAGGERLATADSPARIVHFQRGEHQLLASIEAAPDLGTFVSLRLDRSAAAADDEARSEP